MLKRAWSSLKLPHLGCVAVTKLLSKKSNPPRKTSTLNKTPMDTNGFFEWGSEFLKQKCSFRLGVAGCRSGTFSCKLPSSLSHPLHHAFLSTAGRPIVTGKSPWEDMKNLRCGGIFLAEFMSLIWAANWWNRSNFEGMNSWREMES